MSAVKRKGAAEPPARSDTLETTAAIICDNVRHEVTGKQILIGVYTGTILVPSFPAALTLALWLEQEPRRTGTVPFSVRLATDRGTVLFSAEMEFEILAAEEPATLVFGGIRVPLTDPCALHVEVREGDAAWRTVKRKRVARRPDPESAPAA